MWLRTKKDIGDIATGWVSYKYNILQEHNDDIQLKIEFLQNLHCVIFFERDHTYRLIVFKQIDEDVSLSKD